jgi:hypothetical protein
MSKKKKKRMRKRKGRVKKITHPENKSNTL